MNLNKEVWNKLELRSVLGEKINARLAMPEISKRLYVGLDSFRQRHLLIPLEESDEEYNDSQSKGLLVLTKD